MAKLTEKQIDDAVGYNKRMNYAPSTWKEVQKACGAGVDGVPGPQTTKCAANYQEAHSLAVDGKVGKGTLSSMSITPKYASYTKYDIMMFAGVYPDLCFGIDVSNYQGSPDWCFVSKQAVSFVVIKATQGRSHKQSKFEPNMDGTAKNNIPRTAYHLADFVRDGKVVPVEDEFANFHTKVKGYTFDFPAALDLETTKVQGMVDLRGAKEAATWIEKWSSLYHAEYGVNPILYLSQWGAQLLGKYSGNLPTYQTWWADYNSKTRGKEPKRYNWPDWTFRQFTGSGKVLGITGDVDLDYFNGTCAEFSHWVDTFGK